MKKLIIIFSLLFTFIPLALATVAEHKIFRDVVIEHKPFQDIDRLNPNFASISYIKEKHIVNGYRDGTFRPQNKINRAEFTKIIIGAKFSKSIINNCQLDTLKFPDIDKGFWYAPYICIAKQYGIINGYPDGKFRPNRDITFIEASKIISQTFEYSVQKKDIWYEGFVLALESRKAIPNSISSLNHNITRGEMAEMIFRLKKHIITSPSKTLESLKG